MGEQACLYILFGTHTWLASLIYVPVLLSRDFHVSTMFNHAFESYWCFLISFLYDLICGYIPTFFYWTCSEFFLHLRYSFSLSLKCNLAGCRNYGVPLHLIRELYETFRNFKIRIADYLRYRKITSNMNDRFPDATSEELDAWVNSVQPPVYHCFLD